MRGLRNLLKPLKQEQYVSVRFRGETVSGTQGETTFHSNKGENEKDRGSIRGDGEQRENSNMVRIIEANVTWKRLFSSILGISNAFYSHFIKFLLHCAVCVCVLSNILVSEV